MSNVRIEVRVARLNAALNLLAPTAQRQLATFIAAFGVRLLDQVRVNIVQLFRSTGPLYRSVRLSTTDKSATVYTQGVPYAKILEEGGVTPAHVIVPRTASILAFEGPDGLVFAKRVNHPGSRIPAYPYMSTALTMMRGEFDDGIRDVVAQAKGELEL